MRKIKNTKQCFIGWHYQVSSEIRYHTDLGNYLTYAVTAIQANRKIIMHDVSASKKIAVQMAQIFNQYSLAPIHLQDVVEDMLP